MTDDMAITAGKLMLTMMHPEMLFVAQWSGTSRGKVRSTWPESMVSVSAILLGSINQSLTEQSR